jgi:hypothetical protein
MLRTIVALAAILPGGWARAQAERDPDLLVPIVERGQARFRVEAAHGGRFLVVVSCLARGAGPYPFWMVARGVDGGTSGLKRLGEWNPPDVAEVGAREPQAKQDVIPWAQPAERREFFLLSRPGDPASEQNYSRVEPRLRALGRSVQVYVDRRDVERVDAETLRDVVETFDGRVHERAEALFGPAADIDADGRFTIVISRALESLARGGEALDGFVRGADFDRGISPPFGNRCDMMYLNARLESGSHLRTVIAHEYTHAVTFCRKVLQADAVAGERLGHSARDEEGWLDEALAHLVEDLHGFSRSNLEHRVRAYLAAPERYRLVVRDYYGESLFRSHGHRGAAYLFLRWCADRFGPELLPALVKSRLTGIPNLEAATGTRFEELYRRWSVAQFLKGLEDGAGRVLPRVARLHVDGAADRWVAEGTTSHFAVVDAHEPRGRAVEVEVIGVPDAQIQVTVVRLSRAAAVRRVEASADN